MGTWEPLGEIDYKRLAAYNAERRRGLVHTDAYRQEMAELQRRFDEYMTASQSDTGHAS